MDIKAKIKSLKSIHKITSTMKAISASKYHHAEKQTNRIKICGKAVLAFYDRIEVSLPQTIESKTLYVAVTSDRGLCGACNTQVCHFIKHDLEKEKFSNSSVMCIGVTGTNMFKYYHPDLIVLSVSKLGKTLPSFLEASEIAQQVIKLEDDFNNAKIIYNEYINISSFITQQLSIYNTAIVYMTPKLIAFGNVLLETIQSYLEFSLAMILFYVIRASYTSEQGARFKAMVNATTNVENLQKKLTIINYKARQAAITSELTEIVAAAAALENKK